MYKCIHVVIYFIYRCNNGECINAVGRCNGIPECGDLSDEIDCNITMIPKQRKLKNLIILTNVELPTTRTKCLLYHGNAIVSNKYVT